MTFNAHLFYQKIYFYIILFLDYHCIDVHQQRHGYKINGCIKSPDKESETDLTVQQHMEPALKKKNAQIYIQSSSKLKEIERDKITCLSVSFYTVKAVTDKIILKLLL